MATRAVGLMQKWSPLVVLLISQLIGCTDPVRSPQCSAAIDCMSTKSMLPCEMNACIAGQCAVISRDNGAPCDDGNLCTVTASCNAGQCTVDEAVNCPDVGECVQALGCDSSTGECRIQPVAEGTPCDDGLACTSDGVCQSSECVSSPINCDDGISCTLDSCSETEGCIHDETQCDCSLDSDCDDGNPCNGTETCDYNSRVCKAGSVVNCSAWDNDCTEGQCNPITGSCVSVGRPDGTACDDNNACTTTDTCSSGLCVGQDPIICVTDSSCLTGGLCDKDTGQCSYTALPDGTVCSDGDACTMGESCSAGQCTLGIPKALSQVTGEAKEDELTDVVSLTDGGTIAVGVTHNTQGMSTNGWLVRFDQFGEIMWERQYGGLGPDVLSAVASDHSDGWILVGRAVTINGPSVWVIKVNSNGDVLWQKSLNYAVDESAPETGVDVIQRYDGTIAVLASSGDFTVARVVVLSELGEVLTTYDYTHPEGLRPASIADRGINGFALAGVTGPHHNTRGWFAMVDSKGAVTFEKVFYGSSAESISKIISLGAAGYYLVGATTSMGQGKSDGWIIRLTVEGGIVWDATYGTPSEDILVDGVALGPMSEPIIYVVGHMLSPKYGSRVGWMMKIGSNGAKLDEHFYTMDLDEADLTAISKTPAGGVVAVGSANGAATSQGDGWLLKAHLANEICLPTTTVMCSAP